MKIVSLGKSGLKVSQVCLGTMTFGREADEAASFAIMDYFVEHGGTFLDTADAYSNGRHRVRGGPMAQGAPKPRQAWCWPPRCSHRWEAERTTPAFPGSICTGRWRKAFCGCRPT